MDAHSALYEDPRWRPGFDEVWDCRGINEFVVSLEEIRAVADMEMNGQERIGRGRVALVTTNDLVLLIGQLYQMLVEKAGRPVYLGRGVDDAAVWLGLDALPVWLDDVSGLERQRRLVG